LLQIALVREGKCRKKAEAFRGAGHSKSGNPQNINCPKQAENISGSYKIKLRK